MPLRQALAVGLAEHDLAAERSQIVTEKISRGKSLHKSVMMR